MLVVYNSVAGSPWHNKALVGFRCGHAVRVHGTMTDAKTPMVGNEVESYKDRGMMIERCQQQQP